MSGFSRVLMDLGNTINRYSVVFIAVLAVIAIGFFATTTPPKVPLS